VCFLSIGVLLLSVSTFLSSIGGEQDQTFVRLSFLIAHYHIFLSFKATEKMTTTFLTAPLLLPLLSAAVPDNCHHGYLI
jgi:hypothetical protein